MLATTHVVSKKNYPTGIILPRDVLTVRYPFGVHCDNVVSSRKKNHYEDVN